MSMKRISLQIAPVITSIFRGNFSLRLIRSADKNNIMPQKGSGETPHVPEGKYWIPSIVFAVNGVWAETCLIYTLKLWATAALEFLCTASANTDISLSLFFWLNRQWGKGHPQQEKLWFLHPLVEDIVVSLVHLPWPGVVGELSTAAMLAGTWGALMSQLHPSCQ